MQKKVCQTSSCLSINTGNGAIKSGAVDMELELLERQQYLFLNSNRILVTA